MATVIYKKKRKQIAPTNPVEKKTIETKITKQQKDVIESKQTPISPEEVKKIRAAKLKLAKYWMRKTWPHLFSKEQKENPKPLMVHIDVKIMEEFRHQGGFDNLGFSTKQIKIFISRWVSNAPYLKNIIEGKHRYNLDGDIAQPITEIQVKHAQEAIKHVVEYIKK